YHPRHARRQHIGRRGQDAWQFGTQEALSLPHRNAALQQEGADLIDDAGALADQPLPDPVQRLQIELVRRLSRNELHGWPLHSFGDRFSIAEVILLPFRIGADVFCWHQPGIVAKAIEFATEMMRANAGFHADQARRQVSKSVFHLTPRPLLAQHYGTTLIVATMWNEFLPISMPMTATAVWAVWDMACSLSWAPLASFICWRGRNTAGPSH